MAFWIISALFSLTLFLNSSLLFLMEPMFAKRALPFLGGSPQVWNTCMMFYQVVLLAGYVYAHFLDQRISKRGRAILQTLALVIGGLSLQSAWNPPAAFPEQSPVWWLLRYLIGSIGLSFFALSANGPLIQRWFKSASRESPRDVYWLFSISNLGSLLALLSFPLFIEPVLSVSTQIRWWCRGYVALVILSAVCEAVWWVRSAREEKARVAFSKTFRPEWGEWVLLAFIPSSLMLGLTAYLTTDIAPVPLLWVLPLALYLATFVIAFGPNGNRLCKPLVVAVPVIVTALLIFRETLPYWYLMGLHVLGFWVMAMVCHGQLAERRPSSARMTEFYCWVVFGGALGGLLNALLAPVLFHSVLEYPLALLLAAWIGTRTKSPVTLPISVNLRWPSAVGMILIGGIASFHFKDKPLTLGPLALLVMALAIFAVGSELHRHRGLLATVLASVIIMRWIPDLQQSHLLYTDRSFFGVYRVALNPRGNMHVFFHGSTLHGCQSLDPKWRQEPVGTYYDRHGPLGQMFGLYRRLGWHKPVAVVGLGVGSMIAYAQTGEAWSFYEIDPAVERIARDTRFFTFLKESHVPFTVVLGDARLSLAQAPNEAFGFLLIDAFGSDAIPVHLLTREALELYLRKLAPNGLLAFHITNRYLNLGPRLTDVGRSLGLTVVSRQDPGGNEGGIRRAPSHWVLMTRNMALLAGFMGGPSPKVPPPDHRVWTDDYSDLLSAFRIRL